VSRFLALTKRELLAYFYAPVPYIVMFLFLLLTWFIVEPSLQVDPPQSARIDYMFVLNWLDFALIFFIPLLTMNTVAEERSKNTIEMLLTAPVADWQVVVSKWLGSFTFYVVMLVPTLIYWVVFLVLGHGRQAIDPGPVLASYLGALLLGGLYIAIGIFASSLTEDGPLSACLAFVMIILLMVGSMVLHDSSSETWRSAADYISQRDHFQQFLRGKVPVHDLVYFVMMTTLFLFFSVRALESRKWR
jgi:ABC-2 type transport system permease protein